MPRKRVIRADVEITYNARSCYEHWDSRDAKSKFRRDTKKTAHRQDVKAEATNGTAAAHGDAVDISEEGRQKSAALRTGASGKALSDGEADSERGSADVQVASTVSVADLKKELQQKKIEVKSKQAKLDEAAQAAANDPSKEAQLNKLKNQVTQLEKEAAKIQSKLYSS